MYKHYKEAGNAAWRTLIECEISSLPVDLNVIANHYDIKVIPYTRSGLIQVFSLEAISGDGFITKVNGQKVIFLNDNIEIRARRRFTVGYD